MFGIWISTVLLLFWLAVSIISNLIESFIVGAFKREAFISELDS